MPCEFPCKTCLDGNPTKCYSCGYGGHDVRNAPTSSNRNCDCKSGYYISG